MRLAKLNSILKFLLQFSISGLAIAFILLFVFPDRFMPAVDRQPNNIPNTIKNPAEIVSYNEAISIAAPAVVNVYAQQFRNAQENSFSLNPLIGNQPPNLQINNNLGSGVILNESGYLLTNALVITEANDVQITLTDGRQTKATIVGVDTETDLAVLQIELDKLPIAAIGNSNSLKVGDVVLAIGNPYNFGQTVTQGIVSATRRNRVGINLIEDYIQTDAAINPGNSGGALINTRGEVIGINTLIYSNTGGSLGIGFAIPIDMAIDVMQQLIRKGYVERGWLGIALQPVPIDIANALNLDNSGIIVMGVQNNGPAANAGVMPGDIITKVNGNDLVDAQQAVRLISEFTPGELINLDIIRGWDRIFLSAEVSQRPRIIE